MNARTGEIALDLLDAADAAGHPFAAVIVDMGMTDTEGLTVCRTVRASPRFDATGLVLLTSTTWNGDGAHLREMGVAQLASRPAPADLLDIVARCIADPRAPDLASREAVQQPQLPRLAAHILVAEDNPVNEEVVRELLLGLGCTVQTVGDGHSACTAFEARTFDIVLMDCQMPGMDGLVATGRMRQLEQRLGRPRTPIIAVTAHAFEADRVACRTAGMDDYLMKPLSERELANTLVRWLGQGGATRSETADVGAPAPHAVPVKSGPADAGLDHAFLADMNKRRPQLFGRLLQAYLTHAPSNVGQLLDAVASADVQALHLAAHSLKSSSANVGAKRVAELARQIEAMARSGSVQDLAGIADDLRCEFARTQLAMKAALAERGTGT